MTGSWPAVAAGGNIQTAVGTDFSSSSSHTGTTGQGPTVLHLSSKHGHHYRVKEAMFDSWVSFWLKNYLYVPEVALFSSQDSFKVDVHNQDKNV